MHVIALFLLACVIAVFSFFAFPHKNETVVKGVSQEVTATVSPALSPTPTGTWHPVPTVTQKPTTTPTEVPFIATPTSMPQQPTENIIYPNAANVQKSGTTISFQTADSADAVTTWYKNLISSLHMNTQTFIKTSTNGNITNKLVGANADRQLRVDITKQSTDTMTSVVVTAN